MFIVDKYRKVIICTVLFTILLVGVRASTDYGLGWDEKNNRQYGHIIYNHVFGAGDNLLERYPSYRWHQGTVDSAEQFWHPTNGQFAQTHGPVYEVFLFSVERLLSLDDSRDIYQFRHLAGFCTFFIGIILFYSVCFLYLKSWKLALLGVVLLVLSPRLFSHAFHNSIDIPFFTAFTLCLLTLYWFLEKKTFLYALAHACATALLVDIRIAGGVVPVITFAFYFLDCLVLPRKRSLSRLLGYLAVYAAASAILTALLWPALWGNSIVRFIDVLRASGSDPWPFWEIYFGHKVYGRGVPWHFTPVWLAITTPPLYLVFFVAGMIGLLQNFRTDPARWYSKRRFELAALAGFLLPLIVVAVTHATLFNGWRHLFFIYSGFLVIALSGVRFLANQFHSLYRIGAVSYYAFIGIIAVSLGYTGAYMYRIHPYQNVYFNQLVGGLQGAKGYFEIGFWGVEYREGLEYLIKYEQDPEIRFWQSDEVTGFNRLILPREDRDRLILTPKNPEYYLGNYFHFGKKSANWPKYYNEKCKVWSRTIDGVEILSLFRFSC